MVWWVSPVERRTRIMLPLLAPVGPTRGCEQLQGDVVGVTERQGRAVVGVGDPAVVDAELLQAGLPFLQLGPVGDPEREVVQAGAVLVEAVLVAGVVEECWWRASRCRRGR